MKAFWLIEPFAAAAAAPTRLFFPPAFPRPRIESTALSTMAPFCLQAVLLLGSYLSGAHAFMTTGAGVLTASWLGQIGRGRQTTHQHLDLSRSSLPTFRSVAHVWKMCVTLLLSNKFELSVRLVWVVRTLQS